MPGNRWMEKQYNQMALLRLWLHCPCHTLRTKLPCHLLNIRQLFQSPGLVAKKNKAQKAELAHIFPTKYWAGLCLTHILSKASNTMPGIKQQIVHWQSTVRERERHSHLNWPRNKADGSAQLRSNQKEVSGLPKSGACLGLVLLRKKHFTVYTTPRSSCNKLTRFFIFTDIL